MSNLKYPTVEWCEGASILTTSKGGHCDLIGGGLRTYIQGFSNASRYRLLKVIGKVKRDSPLPQFITLTYPYDFPNARESKHHLNAFIRRLKRRFLNAGLIWKLEPQERGAPHYHILIWGCDLQELKDFVPQAWFEIAGGGDRLHKLWHLGKCGNGNQHCVQQVKSFRGVWAYASKYLGKTFAVEGWKMAGRFWGVVNPEGIPFGEVRSGKVERHEAVQIQRYQRRFSHMRSRGRSMTTFCDADQWVDRLVGKDSSFVLDDQIGSDDLAKVDDPAGGGYLLDRNHLWPDLMTWPNWWINLAGLTGSTGLDQSNRKEVINHEHLF